MKQSVLIVTENFTVGGLETHIKTYVEELIYQGVEVHLLTGVNSSKELLPEGLASFSNNLIATNSISYAELAHDVNLLCDLIQKYKITHIHAHPFISLFIAYLASIKTKIPFFITLHGPLSIYSYLDNYYDLLLRYLILPNAQKVFVVSEELANLIDPYVDKKKIVVQNNGFNLKKIVGVSGSIKDEWILCSRLDSEKLPGIQQFLLYAKDSHISKVNILGDGIAKPILEDFVNKNNLNSFVEFLGFSHNAVIELNKYAGVAGMGRVAQEGILLKKPTVLVGYDGVKGLIDNITDCLFVNFSGRSSENISIEKFQKQISISSQLDTDSIYNTLIKYCDISQHVQDYKIILSNNIINDSNTILFKAFENYKYLFLKNLNEPILLSETFFALVTELLCLDDENYCKFLPLFTSTLNREKLSDINCKLNSIRAMVDVISEQTDTIRGMVDAINEQANTTRVMVDTIGEQANAIRETVNTAGEKKQFVIYTKILSVKEKINLNKIYRFLYYSARSLYRALPIKNYAFVSYYKNKFFCWYQKKINYIPNLDLIAHIEHHDKIIFINSAFEFDDLVNQRPINAAKYFANNGYLVIFIVWQWNPGDKVSNTYIEIIDNVMQIPLYDFIDISNQLILSNKIAIFLNTLPAKIFDDALYNLRKQGVFIAYDIMDEWSGFYEAGQAPWFDVNYEKRLVLQSDSIFVVSPQLKEKFISIRSDIVILGNGYSEKILGNNKNIANLESHTVGYFGHLTDSWFDWDLLFKIANEHKNLTFEIIGYGEPEWVNNSLKRHDNVKLLGKIHPTLLYKYVKDWKLGLIPFKSSGLSAAVDPIKIYEYIYFGLPTFVTGIEAIKSYPMTYYATQENFLEVFSASLSCNKNNIEYEQFLLDTTWDARFSQMESCILSKNGVRNLYE